MKKLLSMLLLVSMVICLAACGRKDDDQNTTPAGKESVIIPEVTEDTMGSALWDSFLSMMTADPEKSALDIANALAEDPVIQFMSGSAEAEPGLLAGFSTEITGFKSGASFGPMMSSIAFIGYVFELEEGADVNAFIATLTESSDPRWGICVEAEQTVVGAYNNMVFFLMCPASNEG